MERVGERKAKGGDKGAVFNNQADPNDETSTPGQAGEDGARGHQH